MNFGTAVLSKLGLGADSAMSSILPPYNTSRRGRSNEHSLDELEPRPDDALLTPDYARGYPQINEAHHGSLTNSGNFPGYNVTAVLSSNSTGKAKATVNTYRDSLSPPSASPTADSPEHDHRKVKKANQGRQESLPVPEIWRPSFISERHDSTAPNAGPRVSFLESMFLVRPDPNTDRTPTSQVDQTFRAIRRRERQMQKELQALLDAQGTALERDLMDLSHEKRPETPVSSSASAQSNTPEGHVMPVRQPRRRPLSKRQARVGITRCMSMLSDLKNEEDAFIATALAERKSALSRLRNLSSQKKSITAEMQALEAERELPIKVEIRQMENELQQVHESIEKCEERLRRLRNSKASLESKIESAKSVRDSSLSGYKGALRECDKKIGQLMQYPGIQVLEVEDLAAQDDDLRALVGEHVSGFEFLSLRPERRTLELAKEWWEGEVQILDNRKAVVDKDRAALEEGAKLWEDTLELLAAHDAHMTFSLNVVEKYSFRQLPSKLREPGVVLQKQYKLCKTTVGELQTLHDYVEAQGWNLLVAAIGAELNFYSQLKSHLGETLRLFGYAEGVVTPPPRSPSPGNRGKGDDLVDVHDDITSDEQNRDFDQSKAHSQDDELSRSVIRRWEGSTDDLVEEQQARTAEDLHKGDNDVPDDLLAEEDTRAIEGDESEESGEESQEDDQEKKEVDCRGDDSDNEVPPDLLISVTHDDRHGSEDEQHKPHNRRDRMLAEVIAMHYQAARAAPSRYHTATEELAKEADGKITSSMVFGREDGSFDDDDLPELVRGLEGEDGIN